MVIEIHNLFKYYQRVDEITESILLTFPALKGLNLTVPNGSTVLIMGPSGSGKTSLLNILSTTIESTSGTVIVNDSDLARLTKQEKYVFRWKNIGYLKQTIHENFIENLYFREMQEFYKANPIYKNEEVIYNELLSIYANILGLTENHLVLKYQLLSGGEKQRVGLLFLLFKNPETFLLDEPTSYLDEQSKFKVISILEELKKKKKTIIITSHDQIFYKISDEIYFLKVGQLASENTMKILPELITGKILLPIKRLNSTHLEIPYLILKIFTTQKILRFSVIKNENKNSIIFFPITKSEFYKSDINDLYYHENDVFSLDQFHLKSIDDIDTNEENIDLNYWSIEKDTISLIFKGDLM